MNLCQCLQCKAINRAMDSCKREMDEIANGKIAKPPTFQGDSEIWTSMQEERYDYLEGFMMKLKFIVDYPEKEMQV